MVGKLFLARHGERLDFVDKEWHKTAQNIDNPPLTKKGLRQARALGERLKRENIQHILVSPFLRTLQTADQVARVLNLPLKIELGAAEWLNSEWFGSSPPRWTAPRAADALFNVDLSYVTRWPTEGAATAARITIDAETVDAYAPGWYPETRDKVLQRGKDAVHAIAREFCVEKGENVLIVGHGMSVECMTRGLVPDGEIKWITYCCLTECIPNEDGTKWTIGVNCDDSFLADIREGTPPHYH